MSTSTQKKLDRIGSKTQKIGKALTFAGILIVLGALIYPIGIILWIFAFGMIVNSFAED